MQNTLPFEVPFAPGRSGFNVKGVVYLGGIEFFESALPGGQRALDEALRPFPALHEHWRQPFFASNWYDVFPLVQAFAIAAILAGVPSLRFVETAAALQAKRDRRGVYKNMLGVDTPRTFVQLLPRSVTQYMDYVTCEARMLNDRSCEIVTNGVPAVIAWWQMSIQDAFALSTFRAAGAANPRTRRLPLVPGGSRRGIDLVTLVRVTDW